MNPSTSSDNGYTKAPLIGLVLLGVMLVAISAAATQYVAARLSYHPALGAPLFGKIYAPWAWFEWQARYYENARATFNTAYVAFLTAVGVTFMGFVLAVGFRTRSAKRHEGVHGTAHWATKDEIMATGLLPRPGKPGAGVYVGGWTDANGHLYYLRHNGPEHIAGIAPTRSGKGVGLVIPTLLSWPHSCVVNDQKEELWNLTAAWRQQNIGPVHMFNPTAAEDCTCINPLNEIRLQTVNEVGDIQNLVTILVDPEGKGLVDHWAKTSHAFLTGAILHVMYKARAGGREAALPDIALALSDPARPVEALYAEMLENTWGPGGAVHPTIAAAARDMLNRPDEERGSVLSTAMSFLSIYRDPLIAKNVSHSDIKLHDLMNSEKPVTLYLVAREEDKDRLKPLMRLIINQLVRVLLRPKLRLRNGQPLSPHQHRLLLMLDEFPSYGRLDVFQEALSYIAGYGIKAYLIMQDIAQLWGAYGQHESIISNCHVRVAYAPNKIETAEWLSKMTGQTTIVKEDISTSGHRFGAILQNVTRTFHEVARPLATADEIARLKAPEKDEDGTQIVSPGDVLVFVAGHPPIKGTQILYFRDPVFAKRVRLPVPPPTPAARAGRHQVEAFKL
jgi:type IV secretion system protein VirD4